MKFPFEISQEGTRFSAVGYVNGDGKIVRLQMTDIFPRETGGEAAYRMIAERIVFLNEYLTGMTPGQVLNMPVRPGCIGNIMAGLKVAITRADNTDAVPERGENP